MGDSDEDWFRSAGHQVGEVGRVDQLSGGAVSVVRQVHGRDGRAVVVKTAVDPPADLFGVEAAGLEVLGRVDGLRVPRVLDVGINHLVLEAFNPHLPDSNTFWEEAGQSLARLHQRHNDRFGWPHDGWLGRLPQINTWTSDGHAFFAEHRLQRYLAEPKVRATLSPQTSRGIEVLCERLDDLIPSMPASLTHGDVWRNNLVVTPSGAPAFIDPAVAWTWAEVDLSMALCTGGVPDRFFSAYAEAYPPADGWRERAAILHLRELLSVVAHFGADGGCVEQIEQTVRRFAPGVSR